MSSRFAHFDNGANNNEMNNHLREGELSITAGLGFRSPPSGGGQDPEFKGSFVTAVVNDSGKPRDVTATIVRPNYDDVTENITHQRHRRSAPGSDIGHVTLSDGSSGIHNGHLNIYSQHRQNGPLRPHAQPQSYRLPDPCLPFTVKVKNVYANNKTYKFQVKETDTVDRLKTLIFNTLKVEKDQQILNFNGKKLANDLTLGYYKIRENSEIMLELRLRGG